MLKRSFNAEFPLRPGLPSIAWQPAHERFATPATAVKLSDPLRAVAGPPPWEAQGTAAAVAHGAAEP